MNEHVKHNQYHFFVDAKEYTTDQSSLTGAEIKAKAGVAPNYQLFEEEPGDKPDRAISDGEGIHFDHGHKPKHFYAVPPATFGA